VSHRLPSERERTSSGAARSAGGSRARVGEARAGRPVELNQVRSLDLGGYRELGDEMRTAAVRYVTPRPGNNHSEDKRLPATK
jgi:hypothetical protein